MIYLWGASRTTCVADSGHIFRFWRSKRLRTHLSLSYRLKGVQKIREHKGIGLRKLEVQGPVYFLFNTNTETIY
jgi:hypothetical protein